MVNDNYQRVGAWLLPWSVTLLLIAQLISIWEGSVPPSSSVRRASRRHRYGRLSLAHAHTGTQAQAWHPRVLVCYPRHNAAATCEVATFNSSLTTLCRIIDRQFDTDIERRSTGRFETSYLLTATATTRLWLLKSRFYTRQCTFII